MPYLTLARTYPWTDIEGFQNDVRGHSRGGQPIYSVRMYLRGGNRRWLPSLGNHAQAIVVLYALRQQHGSWAAAATQEALPPPPSPPRRTYRWAQVLVGCLLLALGVLLATGGIAASIEQTRLATSGVIVMATITATQPKTCSKSGCTCPMSWSFTAGSGITYEGTTGTCSSLYDQAEPGVMIPVVYDPSDPTINQPDDTPPNPAGAAAAGSLFGYLVLGAGVAAVIGPLRKRTKRGL